MSLRALLSACLFLLVAFCAPAQTTTFVQQTSNTTAGCGASSLPGYCSAAFNGMSDSNGVFNAVPGNVSTEDIHELLYSGNSTLMFTHFQPWFCMTSSSTTGTGSKCGSHIQVGYNSSDPATVHGQVNDMIQRGFNGTIIDYYGPGESALDATTAQFNAEVSGRCSGAQACPFYYALTYDGGAFDFTACPQNSSTDQTQCILTAMESDFDYMNSHYFGSNGYLRVDPSSMKVSAAGNPVVLFFICETCYTVTPNWSSIWSLLQQHTAGYGNNAPLLYVYRNGGGYTHAESNGAFAWVNWWGSTDTYGLTYLDNFYNGAVAQTSMLTFGAQWKGFDNSGAPWLPAPKVTGQQCGNTWLQTFKQISYNNDFNSSRQLPFSGISTWNDYEEGTEIETGIDNCLTLSASTSGALLSWTPSFTDASGSEATVHHYIIYDSPDGATLTPLTRVASGSHSIDLSQFNLSAGSHSLYVQAIGQPSILNKMSNAVAMTVASPATLQSISVNPTSLTGASTAAGIVTLSASAPAGGQPVQLSTNGSAASVPALVTVPQGASTASFVVTTHAVTSATVVSISAQSGTASASANLTIQPAALTRVSLSPVSIGGTTKTLLSVQLNAPAPAGGAAVTLSSNSAALTVPTTLTVPAGASSASATLTASSVSTTTMVSVVGTYAQSSQSGSLTINVTPSKLLLANSSVVGGKSVAATVSLTGAAPAGGEIVKLQSNSSYAVVPSTVTVPANATSVSFTVWTKATKTTHTTLITATAWGVSKTASMNVKP